MFDQREAIRAEISEARHEWIRTGGRRRLEQQHEAARMKIVALVDELQSLGGRRPANVEKRSTAVRLHAVVRSLTLHQRIMRAARRGTGMRLDFDDVQTLSRDGAIEDCAQMDDLRDREAHNAAFSDGDGGLSK